MARTAKTNKDKEQKYLIEVNRDQLMFISNCIETLSRFASGQVEMDYISWLFEDSCKFRKVMESVKPEIFPELDRNESYDWSGACCENKELGKFIARSYPMYREILHFLAQDENWDNVYSGSTLTCKESEGWFPKITKK